jgi:hypothetical protein
MSTSQGTQGTYCTHYEVQLQPSFEVKKISPLQGREMSSSPEKKPEEHEHNTAYLSHEKSHSLLAGDDASSICRPVRSMEKKC